MHEAFTFTLTFDLSNTFHTCHFNCALYYCSKFTGHPLVLVNFYDSSVMQLRPVMNAKVSSHDTVNGLDNGSILYAGMSCPLGAHEATFSIRVRTLPTVMV